MTLGTAQIRDEDACLLRGLGQYVGDRLADSVLWMHVVRSDLAAGTIRSIAVDGARRMPGVRLILTGRDAAVREMGDFPIRYLPSGTTPVLHPVQPMARDRVRYVGEPIAVIVADTKAQALDAAESLLVEITEEVAVTDAEAADHPDAPRLWPEGNRVFTQELGDPLAYAEALEQAAHVISARIDISNVTAVTMEPRGALALTEGGQTTLFTGTQAPHRVRDEVTSVLHLPKEALRVVSKHVGGSFGMRNGAYPEDVLLIAASRLLKRPVRWSAERLDSFASDAMSRPQSVDVTLALDADHRFLALGLDGYAPVGAYVGPMSLHPMTSSLPALAGVYRTPVLHTVMRGMYVNTMHMAPYRGSGRPEAVFVVERIIDIAAHRLGVDRVALRQKNMIAPDQMPFATPLGFIYDSGDFPKALEVGLKTAQWHGFSARRKASAERGFLRGLGLACSIESAGTGTPDGAMPEFGAFALSPARGLTVSVGSGDCGQGHATVFRQMAQHLLGWTGEITIEFGDTERVAKGVGTFGSRTMGAAGQALSDAASKLIALTLPEAAARLGTDQVSFADGAFRVVGSNRFLTLEDLTKGTGQTYRAEAFTSAKSGTFPNGVHLAEVEIDPETGALEVLRYTVVDDVGHAVNPLLLAGQIHGGVAQGLGQAFLERIVYAPDGALLSGSLMDYAIPRAGDLPMFAMDHSPTLTQANALGVKGAGESGTVGALAAGISAVHDALSPLGVEDVAMPATPHRIWQAIQTASASKVPQK